MPKRQTRYKRGIIDGEGHSMRITTQRSYGEAWLIFLDAGYDPDDFEVAYCGEWASGAEYAKDLAEDQGLVDDSATWPNYCIDWEKAWRELTFAGHWIETGHVFRPV